MSLRGKLTAIRTALKAGVKTTEDLLRLADEFAAASEEIRRTIHDIKEGFLDEDKPEK